MTTLSGYLPSEVASSIYASLDRAARTRAPETSPAPWTSTAPTCSPNVFAGEGTHEKFRKIFLNRIATPSVLVAQGIPEDLEPKRWLTGKG